MLLIESCLLRPVTGHDMEYLFSGRNQARVRMHMLNSQIISLNEHISWFEDMLKSNTSQYYVLMHQEKPSGVIGFYDVKDQSSNWTFYLTETDTPKGLGRTMCFLGLNKIFQNPDVLYVKTNILKHNQVSLHLHSKLGFIHSTVNNGQDILSLCLTKENWELKKSSTQHQLS